CTGVLHREDVAPQRDAGRLERIDREPAMAHASDHGTGGGGLAGFHAGAGERNYRHTSHIELRSGIEGLEADAGRDADALTEVGKVERDPEHAAVERATLLRIDGVAHSEHAADVEQLDDIPWPEPLGHVARVAEQRAAVPKGSRDHIALAE